MKRETKMQLGIFLVASLILFTALLGNQDIGSVDGQVMIENLPEIPAVEDEYIIPDPCELDTVICEGEGEEPEYTISWQEFVEVPSVEEVKIMIVENALRRGVDPAAALEIADCESDFDPYAQNPYSTAKGVYQFLDGTWEWIDANTHVYDAEENIKQFMLWYPVYPTWWEECL